MYCAKYRKEKKKNHRSLKICLGDITGPQNTWTTCGTNQTPAKNARNATLSNHMSCAFGKSQTEQAEEIRVFW